MKLWQKLYLIVSATAFAAFTAWYIRIAPDTLQELYGIDNAPFVHWKNVVHNACLVAGFALLATFFLRRGARNAEGTITFGLAFLTMAYTSVLSTIFEYVQFPLLNPNWHATNSTVQTGFMAALQATAAIFLVVAGILGHTMKAGQDTAQD